MSSESRKKVKMLILLGITTSIIMTIFSFMLIFQERYFWAAISMIGAIVGFICFFRLKIEMNKVENK